MSGKYENGFDYFQTSQNGYQISAILSEEAWYFPWGTTNPFGDPAAAISCVSPGRWGYGKRLAAVALFESGRGNPNPWLQVKLVPATANGWSAYGMRIEVDCMHSPFLCVFDLVNNNFQTSITFDANGVIKVWRGPPYTGTFLGNSDAGVWRYGVDFDIEVHWIIGLTAGEIEVRIHTVGAGGPAAGSTPAIHLTGINTQGSISTATTFDGVAWGWLYRNNSAATGYIDFKIDDFRYYDTGGSVNNTWIGTCRVQTLMPASNGAVINFTSSNTSLANWQNISNLNIDDTLYLYDANVNDYNLSNPVPLVNATPPIFWVGVLGFYRQDDATQHFVKNRIVSSGTVGDGASFATPQTYAGNHDVFETDPHTSAAFTAAGVNALQFGPLFFA